MRFKEFQRLLWQEQVEKDFAAFGFTEEQFLSLNEDAHSDLAHTHEAPTMDIHKARHNVNIWHSLKAGAHEYFNAHPTEQKRLQHEAKKLRGGRKLFTKEASNPKLAKSGEKVPDHYTLGLFHAPSTMSGTDVCPAASKECKAACLGKESGRAVMEPIKKGRIERTHFMLHNPKHFYANLDHEISAGKRKAKKAGQHLAVRLNGTSDIPHEHLAPELFKKHHDVKFYDYTKVAGRTKHKDLPKNYHLTTSSTGLNHPHSNWKQVRDHLDKGGVASMVFRSQTGRKGGREAGKLPTHVHDHETGKKYRVIDGDEHDHRHLDKTIHNIPHHEGVIAGLRLKGGPKNLARAGHFAVHINEHGFSDAHAGAN